jgi:hypothetical protein
MAFTTFALWQPAPCGKHATATCSWIANVVDEIRGEIPLSRVTHMVVIGGDVRFAASQILESEAGNGVRAVTRDAFLAFCDSVERLDEEQRVDRFRLPAVEAEMYLFWWWKSTARGRRYCRSSE